MKTNANILSAAHMLADAMEASVTKKGYDDYLLLIDVLSATDKTKTNKRIKHEYRKI